MMADVSLLRRNESGRAPISERRPSDCTPICMGAVLIVSLGRPAAANNEQQISAAEQAASIRRERQFSNLQRAATGE